MRRVRFALGSLFALVAVGPAIALAQSAPPGPPPAPAGQPAAQPADPGPTDAPTTPLPALTGSLGGYSWGDAPKPSPGRRWVRRATGPEAALPGFEELADGASRLFVEMTKSVSVDEKKAPGSLTFVLKGAHVRLRNNMNALVTVHFNTPVTRARLVPSGANTLFVVDLRADVSPTWKMIPAKQGTAVLQIEFPGGNYLGGPAPAAAAPGAGAPAASSR
jgi:hypothetical protein